MPIKIKGKEYPIRPTMWALLQFKREKNKSVSEIKDDEIEDLLYWTYLCVKNSCKQDGIDFAMTFEDYCEYVDGSPIESLVLEKAEGIKKKTESR